MTLSPYKFKTYLAHRKGNKRNPPCDTDTLKKLTAVQCLMEAVSSEQEITKIENLVDELCKKLNEIENNQDDEIKLMEDIRPSKSSQSPKLKTNELDDPRKRYYRAFPALSKEMEDSVWITKRNIKALTWPNDTNTFITSTTIISNATPNVVNSLTNNTAGVKNKSKRRRNQAMSKGKTGGNIRKNSYSGNTSSPTCWDTDFEGSWEMGRDLIKEFMMKQNSHRNRSTSESGAYNIHRSSNANNFEKRMKPSITTKPPVEVEDEVGAAAAVVTAEERIGERATAAATEEDENYEIYDFYDPSDERNIKIQQDVSNTMKTKKMDSLNLEISLNDDISITSDASSTTTLQKHEISVSDNAFTLHNDTCSKFDNSKETLMVDGILNSMARRLYERDISSNDSLNQQCCSLSSTSSTSTSSTTEQNDFAQFKAKFNSSIEALWKNNSNNNNNNDNEISSLGAVGIVPSSVTAVSSSTSSSFKHKNLENFWTNYYNHHYDVEKFDDAGTDKDTVTAISGVSGAASVFDNDGVDETDFFSMPLNFDATKTDKFDLKKLSGDNYTSTGVFLQNSIWSDRGESGSFYGNPLQNSNKTELKIDNSLYETTDDIAAAAAAVAPPSSSYSFNISKWSECSFETPFVPSSSTTSSVDSSFNKNDLRENMLKNSYLYNYKQPVAPTSNNNVSGSGIIKNITIHQHQQQHQSTAAPSLSLPADILIGATSTTDGSNNATTMNSSHQKKITLINHSINSGFVEYSRIKSICNNNVSLGPLSSFKSSSTSKKIIDNNYQSSSKRSSSSSIISSSPLSSSVSGSSATGNNDDENLLTSDRTHFRPIKQSYADGYVFDIPNNLDDVKFERSESGYLYFESEKYLEYTRFDSFLSDEDPVIFSSSSTSKAKAKALATSSSIKIIGKKSTATAFTAAPLKSIINRKHKKGEFALKFRILQTEKYCQTENLVDARKELNNVATAIAANMTKNKNDVNNKSKDMLIVENYNCNDSSSESMLLLDNSNSSNNSNENSSSNDTDYYLKNDESSVNLEQWSMAEIGKKCQNNNNTTHTLWGMCPACNKNSMKSLPANRLLKDELNVEADEIMSDLKYMQDLYIGGGGNSGDGDGSDWVENDDIDTDEDIDNDNEAGNCGDHDDDTDCDADMLKECELYETFVVETLMDDDDDDDNMDDNDDDDDGDYDNNDDNEYNKNDNDHKLEQQQDHIYYDVTKFISDLLKPENAKSLANALGATTKNIYNKPPNMMANENDDCCYDRENDNNNSIKIMNKNVNNEKYVGGLWSNNDENMIWTQQLQQQQQQQQQQQKDEKNQQNSINEEFLMKLRKNSSTTSLSSSAATFLETFSNWKYSNLAELWKNTSTTTSSSSSSTVSASASNCGGSCNVIKNNEIISENNNIKNFQSFNDAFQKQQKLSSSLSNNQQPQQLQQQQQQLQQLNTSISSSPQKSSNDDDIIFKIIKTLNDEHKNSTSSTSTTSSTTTTTTADNDGISQKFQKSKFITNRKRRHSASQSYNLTEIINNNSTTTTTTAADKCINNDVNFMKCKNYFDYDNRRLITMKNDDTIKTKLYEFDDLIMMKSAANNKTTKMNYAEKNSNKSPTETIITCKYWAKLTTAPATEISTNQNDDDDNDDNDVNDGNDDITMITSSLKGKSSYFPVNNNKGNNSNNNNNNGSHFDGISTALVLNPSSILKQVAVVTRPLTR